MRPTCTKLCPSSGFDVCSFSVLLRNTLPHSKQSEPTKRAMLRANWSSRKIPTSARSGNVGAALDDDDDDGDDDDDDDDDDDGVLFLRGDPAEQSGMVS